MLDRRSLILLGGGGHCRACIDVVEQCGAWKIEAILDSEDLVGTSVLGYPVAGSDNKIAHYLSRGCCFLVTVGQIKSSAPREHLFSMVSRLGGAIATIVSPKAYVSRHANVGTGSIVMHGAVINAAASVGENTIVNSQALIEHDAFVGNHCHVSTGAIINGGAVVGNGCFVGSGSVLYQGARLEAGTILAAGAVLKQGM